jgi:hypothetical protein
MKHKIPFKFERDFFLITIKYISLPYKTGKNSEKMIQEEVVYELVEDHDLVITKEELTYEILEERFKEQDRLIAEGKMQKPQIIDGLSEEGWAIVERGITLEMVMQELEEKYGKIG